MGELRNPSDPANQGLKTKPEPQEKLDNGKENNNNNGNGLNKRLRFRVASQQGTAAACAAVDVPSWDALLWRGRLYVEVSARALAAGSKEAFVAMLEYAEEELACEHVVVCLEKEKAVPSVVRNFLFLGFQPLAPGHEFLPDNPNLVCFVYDI